MKVTDIQIGDWYKREDYKQDEIAQVISSNLLDIYLSPLAVKMVLDKAIKYIESIDIEGEEWVDVPDYEGLYSISNKGRIKSVPKILNKGTRLEYMSKERMLKPSITKDGYLTVFLCKNGKMKSYALHRLVAIAFIDNDGELSDVNHKDENKLNNCVENLEWCSKAYNTKYGTRTQRTSKQIQQFTKDGKYIKTFKSVKEASRTLSIGSSNIHNCAVGKVLIKDGRKYVCKSAGGFVWKYIEKEIVI